MSNQFIRTQILFGESNMEKLKDACVIVFGVGGVGGYTVEALARSGVGYIDIVDNDIISLSNLNRQILATHKTIGQRKIDVVEQRIKEINPNCKVTKFDLFFLPENSSQINFLKYDYVVDAIDTVSGKMEIIKKAKECKVPIISCMGTGNKIHPTELTVADIYQTNICPLAKIVRKLCRENNIENLKVVYSKEVPLTPIYDNNLKERPNNHASPGSTAFTPAVAGLIIASEVIKDIIEIV